MGNVNALLTEIYEMLAIQLGHNSWLDERVSGYNSFP